MNRRRAAITGVSVIVASLLSAAPTTSASPLADAGSEATPNVTGSVFPHARPAARASRSLRRTQPPAKVRTQTRTSTSPRRKATLGAAGSVDWMASAVRVFTCESRMNPHAVSPTGKYRGLIQADAEFWAAWHGLQFAPRPDLASAAEQLQVAHWAWLRRGWSPWPYCGRLA